MKIENSLSHRSWRLLVYLHDSWTIIYYHVQSYIHIRINYNSTHMFIASENRGIYTHVYRIRDR